MSYKKNLCVYMSFNIKRHIYTSVISWCVHALWTPLKAPMRGLYNTTLEVVLWRDARHGHEHYVSVLNSLRRGKFTHPNFWNATPRLTPMHPNTRLNQGDCDKNPVPDFHWRYRDIVGSLGYLVTMSRLDLAWAYPDLSKYVQFPGENHMLAAEHVLSDLRGTWNQMIRYSRDSHENPKVLWG